MTFDKITMTSSFSYEMAILCLQDIPRYRNWVSKFYRGIQEMAPVSDQDMNRAMTELSMVSA